MKRSAGAFLAGAASRLLPMSIPFRYFGAAVLFHALAWLVLLAAAGQLPRFAGGLGWPLAALHLVTLGVLVMCAIGASLQLLPVATRTPVGGTRWPALIWWVYTPGVAALALGMGAGWPRLLGAGAVAVALALLAWGLLLAGNLRHARGMPAVVGHGWAALASLVALLVTALALVGLYLGWPLLGRDTALGLHVAFAAYGFMGLLALGLSYILVPMFALAATPDERRALGSGALAVLALALVVPAAFGLAAQPLRLAALGLGTAAVLLHLGLMHTALRSGLRRALGRSFVLVRGGWLALLASLLAAAGMVLALPWEGLPMLFGLLLVGGWLLSFLLGMLQRILPFLASMHAARGSRRPPTPASLSADPPLALHAGCHATALAGLAAAVVLDNPRLAALAAAIGLVGALAFGLFFVTLLRRTRGPGHAPVPSAPTPPTHAAPPPGV